MKVLKLEMRKGMARLLGKEWNPYCRKCIRWVHFHVHVKTVRIGKGREYILSRVTKLWTGVGGGRCRKATAGQATDTERSYQF